VNSIVLDMEKAERNPQYRDQPLLPKVLWQVPRNAKIFRGQLDTAPFAYCLFRARPDAASDLEICLPADVPIDCQRLDEITWQRSSPIVVIVVDVDGQLVQMVRTKRKWRGPRDRFSSHPLPLDLAIHADRNVKLEPALRVAAVARELGFRQVIFTGRGAGGPGNSALTPVPRK
jgi:hypothetical protein